MNNFKVLICEDNSFFRKMLKETLRLGFPSLDILEALDGNEALQKIETFRPSLVFMDIKLPDENGLGLTNKIKGRYPDTTVIILSAYDIPEYREAAFRNRADYFLSKGTTTKKEILRLVDSILSHRQPSPT
jgi:CheY-like chemotaxis protein